MNSLTKILVTARLEEKVPIEGYIYLAVSLLIYVSIVIALIAVLKSIPSFRQQGTAFKFLLFALVVLFTTFMIFAVPIAKIISVSKGKKSKIKNPYISQNTVQKSKHTASDIIYCSECGASYIKGEEPDVCTECGNELK